MLDTKQGDEVTSCVDPEARHARLNLSCEDAAKQREVRDRGPKTDLRPDAEVVQPQLVGQAAAAIVKVRLIVCGRKCA